VGSKFFFRGMSVKNRLQARRDLAHFGGLKSGAFTAVWTLSRAI
jgi:hypothetical protein